MIVDFCFGDTAVQMGADVLGLGWRSVVDVAADVEVEVVLRQFGYIDDASETGALA